MKIVYYQHGMWEILQKKKRKRESNARTKEHQKQMVER